MELNKNQVQRFIRGEAMIIDYLNNNYVNKNRKDNKSKNNFYCMIYSRHHFPRRPYKG